MPLVDFASTTSLSVITVDPALIKSPVHRSGNNYHFFHTLPIPVPLT